MTDSKNSSNINSTSNRLENNLSDNSPVPSSTRTSHSHSSPLAPAPRTRPSSKDLGSMTQWQLIRLKFSKHKLAVVSLLVIIALYILAIFAEFFAPYGPNDKTGSHVFAPPQKIMFSFNMGFYTYPARQIQNPVDLTTKYFEDKSVFVPLSIFGKTESYNLAGIIPMNRKLVAIDSAKFAELNPGSKEVPTFFALGSDRYGRDIFSRIIYGSRISLSIGLVSIVMSFFLGLAIGGISGYMGGTVDVVIQRVIEILQAIPGLPLWITLGAVMPAAWPPLWVYFGITIVLSFLGWTGLARTVRGKLLSLREEDYAVAARLLGASHSRIIFRHLLPGFTSHIIVSLTMTIPGMILGETSLSFLGLGLRPPLVSWGVMLQDCLNLDILFRQPWIIMPTVFVILTVISFNFVGDGLLDAADPYHAGK